MCHNDDFFPFSKKKNTFVDKSPLQSFPQFICKLNNTEFTMLFKIQSPAVVCILIQKCILTCIYHFTEVSVAE